MGPAAAERVTSQTELGGAATQVAAPPGVLGRSRRGPINLRQFPAATAHVRALLDPLRPCRRTWASSAGSETAGLGAGSGGPLHPAAFPRAGEIPRQLPAIADRSEPTADRWR